MIEMDMPKIEVEESEDQAYAKVVVEPLEKGFGLTIGNCLRRILLSALPGAAAQGIRFLDGSVKHEFSAVPGVKEDVTEIILNLKTLAIKTKITDKDYIKVVHLYKEGPADVKASDIEQDAEIEIINGDQHICTVDAGAKIDMEITIGRGRGYKGADHTSSDYIDYIPIDSIYTPIRNVKYSVEPYRVEQKTDYDKLVLEVTTDGSISPKDALKEAAKILIYHFMLFSDEKITLENPDHETNQEFDEEVLHMRQLLKTKLVDMNLSVRALNCLKAADVETLGDLVQYNKTDLLKFRNFGKKSLSELDDLLESLNLSFGTDISQYNIDNE